MELDTLALSQITDPALTKDESALLRCQLAAKMAMSSQYEAAREALGELWQGVGERPRLEGLSEKTQAEVLLRAGAISGWLGSAGQIEGAQERAKNLISESARIFEDLGETEKIAEAHIDLAICYWREGALDEARITLQQVLTGLEHSQSEQKLRALLNSAVIEASSDRNYKALEICYQAAPLLEVSSNSALKGKVHHEFALVLKNLGVSQHREDYIDQSLVEYTAAAYHYEEAGDVRACAQVENNIGSLLVNIGKVKDAHKHLNRARQLLVSLRDKISVAHVDETRAGACMAEGRNAEAEKLARSCVRTLENSDQQAVLAEFLTTHAITLSRTGRHQQAGATFQRAIQTAEAAGHLEGASQAALSLIEELGDSLPARIIFDAYLRAEELLSRSQNAALQSRLGQCARQALRLRLQTPVAATAPASAESFTGCSLDEEVLRYEAGLIKKALESADGSVTRAARLLKVTHQGLAFILQGRHKHLLPARTPVRKRRRSIMRAN
jgi:tetratricopeptide (TPR) repeat protein